MRVAFLSVFGWLFRMLAALVVVGIGLGLHLRYTDPRPIDAPLMASAGGQLGYMLGIALEVVLAMAIYAIGSKLLELRNKAGGHEALELPAANPIPSERPAPDVVEGQCVGVDSARQGWLAVWEQGDRLEFDVYADPPTLWAAHCNASVIAVDIPLGLPDHGSRAADVEARRFVGPRRQSSIFPAPVRGILDATTQPEASRRHREIDGRGFGAHAFGILPMIRAWDGFLRGSVNAQSRVYEMHPEVSFAALNGNAGLAESKKDSDGQKSRMRLLISAFGADRVERLVADCPKRMASTDDVLDALVALWTAKRIASGDARTLPTPPAVDSMGLRMAIHY